MFKISQIITFLSIMSFYTLNLSGQSWLSIGTHWFHNEYATYNSEEYVGFEKRTVLSDTIVNGQPCKNIMNRLGGLRIMYEENEKVYLFNYVKDQFELFYDINSSIGNTWSIQRMDLPLEALQVTVMDKALFEMNGHLLKSLIVNVEYFGFNYVDTIIERIGYLGMFAPHMPGIINGQYRGIRCYEDSFLGFVDFDDLHECDYVELPTAVTKLYGQRNPAFDLYPNPFASTVTLNFPNLPYLGSHLRICNALGEMVFERENLTDTVILELSSLPKGIYFVQVAGKHMSFTEKVIKN